MRCPALWYLEMGREYLIAVGRPTMVRRGSAVRVRYSAYAFARRRTIVPVAQRTRVIRMRPPERGWLTQEGGMYSSPSPIHRRLPEFS